MNFQDKFGIDYTLISAANGVIIIENVKWSKFQSFTIDNKPPIMENRRREENKAMSELYGNGVVLTEKVLDFLWQRQTVSLNNVANVDTPGFKSQYITFEEELNKRVSDANKIKKSPRQAVHKAIDSTRSRLNTTWEESSRLDGNNVDMDQEQVEIVRSAYEYQFMLSSLNNDITRLRNAAKSF